MKHDLPCPNKAGVVWRYEYVAQRASTPPTIPVKTVPRRLPPWRRTAQLSRRAPKQRAFKATASTIGRHPPPRHGRHHARRRRLRRDSLPRGGPRRLLHELRSPSWRTVRGPRRLRGGRACTRLYELDLGVLEQNAPRGQRRRLPRARDGANDAGLTFVNETSCMLDWTAPQVEQLAQHLLRTPPPRPPAATRGSTPRVRHQPCPFGRRTRRLERRRQGGASPERRSRRPRSTTRSRPRQCPAEPAS